MIRKRGDSLLFKKAGNLFSNTRTIAKFGSAGFLCGDKSGLYYYLHSDGYQKRHVYNEEFNSFNKDKIHTTHPEGDSVWVATYESLYCVTKKKMTTIASSKAVDADALFYGLGSVYRYSEKKLWLTGLKGAYSISTTPPFNIDTITEFSGKPVVDIKRYKDYLILSVYGKGLYLYDGSIKKIPIREDYSELLKCSSTYINNETGFLWVVADKGLFKTTIRKCFWNLLTAQIHLRFFIIMESRMD